MLMITSAFFSPSGYKLPLRNYHIFLEQLSKQNIPFTIIELAKAEEGLLIPDPSPEYPNHNVIRVVNPNAATLWQRDILINHLIDKHLPAEVDRVAWVDCDIIFENENWYSDLDKKLDEVDVAQPFSTVYRLPPGWTIPTPLTYSCEGAASCILNEKPHADGTGFAWGAKLNYLKSTGGLFDKSIVGGNDCVMLNAIIKKPQPWYGGIDLDWALIEYSDEVENFRPKLGYIDGSIYHLFHGSIKNRQYQDRHSILRDYRFSPYDDIHKNGCWEWTGLKPRLETEVKAYFDGRREDDAAI